MKKVIRCSEGKVSETKLKAVYSAMKRLLDAIDRMDSRTYDELTEYIGHDFHQALLDGVQDLSMRIDKDD